MKNQFYQSSPTNYYTPQKRSNTSQKYQTDKHLKSTAQRFYDLQSSFKQYQQLLEENLHLKNLLFKQNVHNKNSHHKHPHQQSCQHYDNNQMRKHHNHQSLKHLHNSEYKSSSYNNKVCDIQTQADSQYQRSMCREDDMIIWGMKHRNNYLEKKLHNLHNQYHRQTNMIQNIMHSDKWKNRMDCKQNTCYQDKYIKLLRVKSPVLLQ